jgi:glutathione S-transferase
MMPKLTLVYFDVKGSAEPIRLALRLGGVPFEDRRILPDEFMDIKPGLPFGQLPILEVDGEVLPQSAAILRFVGRLTGHYPTSPLLAARCDAVMDGMVDIQQAIRPCIYEQSPARRYKMLDELREATLPLWLGHFEKLLNEAGGQYFVDGRLTIADLAVFGRVDFLKQGVLNGVPSSILDQFPLLNDHHDRIRSLPDVASSYTSQTEQQLVARAAEKVDTIPEKSVPVALSAV